MIARGTPEIPVNESYGFKMPSLLIWCTVGLLFVGSGCSSGAAEKKSAPKAPSSDLDRLAKLVNLPEPPQSAVFLLSRMGNGDGFLGPTDYGFEAVLKYDRDALARLRAHARRITPEKPSIPLWDRRDWYPAPVFSAIKRCEPDGWCIDGERYAGDAFRKGGFVTGSFIVPDGQEYIILMLGT
jgi:hypothetical protein